jgi:hypothetical protein
MGVKKIGLGESGGGGGATNLGYIGSPINGIVTSDTGADATLPLADGTNAGLLKPAKFTLLESITEAFTTALKTTYDGVVTGYNALILTGSRLITSAEITKLSNTSGTNSGDNAVNSLYSGLATSKQDTLVSATNIKTINGNNILGSGDLTIGASLSTAQAFCTAETTLSAATYADITGASISLAAGTWIIFATANGSSQTTTATSMIVAITDSANAVIAEAQQDIAAGTATIRTWGNLSLSAIVTPTGTTTYKLRGARGTTTRTGNCIISDGVGIATNNVSNNSDKSTSIRAIKIA